MQAVILAAGRGTRMGSLTDTLPKPMLAVGDRNLIEHKLDALPEVVDEVIIIVGYLGDAIRQYFGEAYHGKRMRYVEQANPTGGTADALWQAREYLHDRFIILNGDDIYSARDLATLVELTDDWAVLVQKVVGGYSGGLIQADAQGLVERIIEGSHAQGGWANTNTFALDMRIFDQEPVPKAAGSSEMGLPQTVVAASRAQGIPLRLIPATRWIQITAPEDIAKASSALTAESAQ